MASPETRSFLKLSRERLKSSGEHRGDTPILIYESPSHFSSQLSVPRSPGLASLDEHIRIVCADGEELLVPRAVAIRSGCIRHMLEEAVGTYRERLKRVVNLPSLSLEILERVFQFCSMDVLLNKRSRGARRALFRSVDDADTEDTPVGSPLRSSLPASSPVASSKLCAEQATAFCFALPPETVLNLLAAAHFLDIPELLTATCKMVADHIDDVDSLEGLPADAVVQIIEQLPAEKLAAVEEQRKFPDMPDTNDMWRVLFNERGLRVDEWLHQCSWSSRARALGRSLPPDEPQAGKWKSSVLHHLLQTALDGYSPSAHPALMSLATSGSSHLNAAAFHPPLLEESPELLPQLLRTLPNLKLLDLGGCVIAPHIPLLAELLRCTNPTLPVITGLRVAECGLSDADLSSLITSLPPRLELLDLCGNSLSAESLPLLASLLAGHLTHLSIAGHEMDQERLSDFFAAALVAPHLKLLDLGDTPCVIPRLSAEQWARVRQHCVLEQLFLNDTAVAQDMEGFTALCAHLPSRLDHLSLRSTDLRTAHAQVMSQHSPNWKSLVSLDIADNFLNRDTAPFLDALLGSCTNLTSLDVSINSIGEVGGRALAHALSAPSSPLRRLNASGTDLRAGAVDVAGAAVRANCGLVWLAMDAPPPISAQLASLFAQRPSLSVLV